MPLAGTRGRVLQVHPTRTCNLRCEHCYSWSGPEERGGLSASLLSAAITDAAHAGYDVLSISGGEPLLYPSLAEIAGTAHAAGMAVTLTTNGLLLDERRLTGLRGRVDAIAISLDGRPALHDRMRARTGAFAAVESRLPLLRTAGVPFGFVFTLTADNLADVPWAADFALREGAAFLQIHPLESAGRAAGRLDASLPDDRLFLLGSLLATELARRHAGRLRVEIDVVHVDRLSDAIGDGVVSSSIDVGGVPFAELISPLVIEADGTVAPLQHGFARELALGSLADRSLAELMQTYRGRGFPGLQEVCRRTLRTLTAAPLPVVNWYQEVAREAAISARRATAA